MIHYFKKDFIVLKVDFSAKKYSFYIILTTKSYEENLDLPNSWDYKYIVGLGYKRISKQEYESWEEI